jgi:MarR family transcriptional regulator, organic hydroperoxide resistance regulator
MIQLQMQTLHLQNSSRTYSPTQGAIACLFKGIRPMYRLTEAFPYLVTRVGVRMGELISRRLERYGLTLPMYRVMAALWQRGGQRLGDLSEMTTVEISTLSRLVGVMQRRGLLSRTRPDSNARTVEINLTRSGRALVEQLIPLAQRHEEVGLKGFAADEIAGLKKNLVTVYRNLDALDREISEELSTTSKNRSGAVRQSARVKAKEDKKTWPPQSR